MALSRIKKFAKSEIQIRNKVRNSKQSNIPCSGSAEEIVICLVLDFGFFTVSVLVRSAYLNLFRISDFGFRIFQVGVPSNVCARWLRRASLDNRTFRCRRRRSVCRRARAGCARIPRPAPPSPAPPCSAGRPQRRRDATRTSRAPRSRLRAPPEMARSQAFAAAWLISGSEAGDSASFGAKNCRVFSACSRHVGLIGQRAQPEQGHDRCRVSRGLDIIIIFLHPHQHVALRRALVKPAIRRVVEPPGHRIRKIERPLQPLRVECRLIEIENPFEQESVAASELHPVLFPFAPAMRQCPALRIPHLAPNERRILHRRRHVRRLPQHPARRAPAPRASTHSTTTAPCRPAAAAPAAPAPRTTSSARSRER